MNALRSIISILAITFSVSALADITCRGRVLQSEDLKPLIGATVILDKQGALVGTATDLYGVFNLTVPENSIIQFDYVGYPKVVLFAKENMGDIILFKNNKAKNITETVKQQWNEEGLALIAKERFKDAFKRFKAASDKGSARGMFLLAQCYRNESGVKKDMKKYVEYMLEAADNGYDKAQFQVGIMYREGDFLDKNMKTAEAYLKKAADQGSAEAIAALNEKTSIK